MFQEALLEAGRWPHAHRDGTIRRIPFLYGQRDKPVVAFSDYLITFLVATLTLGLIGNFVIYISFIPVKYVYQKAPIIMPLVSGLFSFTANFLSVFVIALVAGYFSVTIPTIILIFFILFFVINDTRRIRRAKSGIATARFILESLGQSYDQSADIRKEYADFVGNFFGLVLGVWVFLTPASFTWD